MKRKRPNMQEWAAACFGPDWRLLGVQPMEAWATRVYGPNWRAKLKPPAMGYKGNPHVVLTVNEVMSDCRAWFLAHAPGVGLKQRVVVLEGVGKNTLAAARRRVDRTDWEFCAVCRLPVYHNEREPLPGGQARHPFCDPPCQDRDAAAASSCGIVDARKEPTYDQTVLPV